MHSQVLRLPGPVSKFEQPQRDREDSGRNHGHVPLSLSRDKVLSDHENEKQRSGSRWRQMCEAGDGFPAQDQDRAQADQEIGQQPEIDHDACQCGDGLDRAFGSAQPYQHRHDRADNAYQQNCAADFGVSGAHSHAGRRRF